MLFAASTLYSWYNSSILIFCQKGTSSGMIPEFIDITAGIGFTMNSKRATCSSCCFRFEGVGSTHESYFDITFTNLETVSGLNDNPFTLRASLITAESIGLTLLDRAVSNISSDIVAFWPSSIPARDGKAILKRKISSNEVPMGENLSQHWEGRQVNLCMK